LPDKAGNLIHDFLFLKVRDSCKSAIPPVRHSRFSEKWRGDRPKKTAFMLIIETSARFLPEKTYTFEVLLRQLLGVEYRIVITERPNYLLRLPTGGTLIVEDHFFNRLPDGDYLHAQNLPTQTSTFVQPYERPEQVTAIYGTPQFQFYRSSIQCGLDVFASAFFMLSRWEEYVQPECDEHGRFRANDSLAWRAGFLERPVVNEYANLLWHMLLRLGWQQPRPEQQYSLQLSYDVDYPRLWPTPLARLRTLGGSLLARRQPRETMYWLKNHFFHRHDPYDTFDELMDLAETAGRPAHFNFLGQRPRKSDAWYALESSFIKNLLKKITERGHTVGFHSSYESFDDPQVFQQELESIRRFSGEAVRCGRQHFLRFAAPQTWQHWADAGMEWDSSLGYSEAAGFRAGICNSYPVFNFLTRQQLALQEKPLIAMDVSLAQYEQLSPEQGFAKLERLRHEVRKHQGEFSLLWHNSSWNTYFWAAWQTVYRSFVTGSAG